MWPLWLCAVLGKLAISLCQCVYHTFSARQPNGRCSCPLHRIRVDQGCACRGFSRILRSFVRARDAAVGRGLAWMYVCAVLVIVAVSRARCYPLHAGLRYTLALCTRCAGAPTGTRPRMRSVTDGGHQSTVTSSSRSTRSRRVSTVCSA